MFAADRRFIHHIGANRWFGERHFPRAAIRQAKVLYVGGFFLMGLTGAALADVFREAQAAGVKTVLDVVTPAGQADHLAELAPVLPFTDAFLPNVDEGHAITGKRDPMDQTEVFRQAGAKTVAITAGSDGCYVAADRERLRAGVYPTTFVDATGGGDAFDAGFIFGMLRELPLRDCIRWGSALGARCVPNRRHRGRFRSSPAEEFMHRHELKIESVYAGITRGRQNPPEP